jgi:hypothetical protein
MSIAAGSIGASQSRTPEGCEECVASGDTWVHLRLCMIYSHVGAKANLLSGHRLSYRA